jgi:Holliday junction resolvase|tara:strand:+ start:503 stop:799 length:297 start_codon:yes stop_codon:yes gene_type:complete
MTKAKKVTEKWVKQQVVKKLKELGAYHFFPVANGYMSSGVPDIIACCQGQFVGIECKANGNKPTALQLKHLRDIGISKGKAILVDENNLDMLEYLIKG